MVGLIREAKKKFSENLKSADQKVFWKTVKLLNRAESSIPTFTTPDGVQASSSSDKASTLNHYFYTCFNKALPPLTEQSVPPLTSPTCPENILISEKYVTNALLVLEVSKSTGIDSISAKMLKHTACSIAPSLTKLFNLSVSAGCLTGKLQELSRYKKLMRCHPQQTIDQFQSSLSLARYWSNTSLAK